MLSTSAGLSIYIQLTRKISQMTKFTAFFSSNLKMLCNLGHWIAKLVYLCNVVPEYRFSIIRTSLSFRFAKSDDFISTGEGYIARYFQKSDRFEAYFRL